MVFDTLTPSQITIQRAFISTAHNCASYRLPRIIMSPSSIYCSIISGFAVAITTFPLSTICPISPVITVASSVSTIFCILVCATDKILLSYTSKYDLDISPSVISPSNSPFDNMGNVTVLFSFI